MEPVLDESCISSINLAEVASRIAAVKGLGDPTVRNLVRTRLAVVPFDKLDAFKVAELLPLTRDLGLSLADRACLALGIARKIPVLTADHAWEGLEIGVKIRLIR